MSETSEPTKPTHPTVKRLFALSGNRCAFPKCPTVLATQTGVMVGEICHIRGKKSGAARFDATQSNSERHKFENLILLCNVHHKVVDDDQRTYSVETLTRMKKDHEGKHNAEILVDDETAERFVSAAISNSTINNTVITSNNQTGGQTAQSIVNHNYVGVRQDEDFVQLEGKAEASNEISLQQQIGSPGVRVTVICRSVRAAKIQSAHLYVEGSDFDFVRTFQSGFKPDFGFVQAKGTTQKLVIELIPLSKPSSAGGFVLNRDDVCRFFYPLAAPSTPIILRVKPEQVLLKVTYFDESVEQIHLNQNLHDLIKSMAEIHREDWGSLKVPIHIEVIAISETMPKVDAIGKVNSKPITFGNSENNDGPSTAGT